MNNYVFSTSDEHKEKIFIAFAALNKHINQVKYLIQYYSFLFVQYDQV